MTLRAPWARTAWSVAWTTRCECGLSSRDDDRALVDIGPPPPMIDVFVDRRVQERTIDAAHAPVEEAVRAGGAHALLGLAAKAVTIRVGTEHDPLDTGVERLGDGRGDRYATPGNGDDERVLVGEMGLRPGEWLAGMGSIAEDRVGHGLLSFSRTHTRYRQVSCRQGAGGLGRPRARVFVSRGCEEPHPPGRRARVEGVNGRRDWSGLC